jgi:hypothetical protein
LQAAQRASYAQRTRQKGSRKTTPSLSLWHRRKQLFLWVVSCSNGKLQQNQSVLHLHELALARKLINKVIHKSRTHAERRIG